MSENNTESQDKNSKKTKKKGPIRFGAIIPTLIIFGLLFAYFVFFFDSNLRWAMQWGATKAHGAEVNIGYVKTSFLRASVAIGNIQITDKKRPTHNLVQVGNITFRARWDGILRGKIVIPLAKVTEIQVKTKRQRPGYVLPVKKGSGSLMKTLGKDALAETQKTLDGNIFGDVAEVLGGVDHKDKLKSMEGNLKTSQFISKMNKELKEKEAQWKKRIETLPKDDDFKKIEARAKAIKVNSKDPLSVIKAIKEIDSLYKEVDGKVKAVKSSSKALSADVKKYKNVYSDIESYIDKDLNDLGSKLGIPSIDPKTIALAVFGRQIRANLQNVERYMRVAREYMPPPKSKEAKAAKAPVRAKGQNYRFPKTKSYPKFWLQKAQVSSKISEEGFSGEISGTIINITNNPKHLGKPAEIKLAGNFPKSDIYDVKAHGVIDHTTDQPQEYGTITVGSFPLKDVELSKSSDLTYGFKQAQGKSQIDFKLINETMNVKMHSVFNKVDYLIETKKKKVKEVLANISKGLGALTLTAKATGNWSDIDLSVRSNLGERLQDSLKAEFNAQVAGYKKQLRAEINKKIGGNKEKLLGKISGFEKKIGLSLKNKESAIASLKQKLDTEKGKAKAKKQDKLKEAGKKLLKDLKFKF